MQHDMIYMDNNATTRTDPRVVEAMLPWFTEKYGNAHSRNHAFGWEAEEAVETARASVAKAIGAEAREIIFTSGATESNNLAIKGVAEFLADKGNHLITSTIEHKCVSDSMKALERSGRQVTFIGVDREGRIDLAALEAAITDKTILISIMAANNEIGTVQDLAAIGKLCKSRGVLFHTDAAQLVGKQPIDVEALGIDLLSMSAHKIYGPKGVGALYIRRAKPRVRLVAQIDGGGQERGLRSGTLNVTGIVGFGKALEIAVAEMPNERARLRSLRDRFLTRIRERLDHIHLNGSLENRIEGNLNISFAFVEGESLLMSLKEVAVSSGSACTSSTLEPSHVMRAIGVGEELAHTSIRFGIGRFNTEAEVDRVVDMLADKVSRLREMSPLYEMVKDGVDLQSVKWSPH